MAFSENLSVFFNSREGDAATFGAATIYGIFCAGFSAPGGVEDFAPTFTCAVADVPAVAHGSEITINSTLYKVRGIEPDGHGVVRLTLEDQS